jgi:hypothetical protein
VLALVPTAAAAESSSAQSLWRRCTMSAFSGERLTEAGALASWFVGFCAGPRAGYIDSCYGHPGS